MLEIDSQIVSTSNKLYLLLVPQWGVVTANVQLLFYLWYFQHLFCLLTGHSQNFSGLFSGTLLWDQLWCMGMGYKVLKPVNLREIYMLFYLPYSSLWDFYIISELSQIFQKCIEDCLFSCISQKKTHIGNKFRTLDWIVFEISNDHLIVPTLILHCLSY